MKLKINVMPISILALLASTIPASTAFADPATDKQIPDAVKQAISEYTTAVGGNYVGTPKTFTRGEKTDADRLTSKMAAETMSADYNLTVEKADITTFNTSAVKSGQDFVVTTDISMSLSQTPNAGTRIIIGNTERSTLESSWAERHTLRLEPVGRSNHTKYVVTSDTIQDEYVAATPDAGVQLPPQPQPSSTEELANSEDDVNTRPDMAPRKPSLSGRSSGFNYLTAIIYADKWTSPPFYGDGREHF